MNLFITVAKDICYKTSKREYDIDEDNKEVITEILKWLICDSSCKLELHKGLFICGGIGTGKTMILDILADMVQISRKTVIIYDAQTINDMYSTIEGKNKLSQGLIGIDDIGTENKSIKVFGTEKAPLYDLLNTRYRYRRLTLATTNIAPNKIVNHYDERFADRCREMFNIIGLTGKSRRK